MNKYKIEIKWALIFAAMMLLWMLLEKVLGLHSEHIDKHAIYTNFVAIPAITLYVFALLDKRKNYFNGIMSYKNGVITGLIITLIVTILSPLTQYITSTMITPEYFPTIINYVVESGKMTHAAASDYFNLQSYMIQGLIGAPVMGIITTVIVAFFVKKDKPN
ncbi:MAG: DUF4199 domain-containing protein [Candidatus Kapabacteria bacterium]|nr:DUF4199 domain-containing protein [Candidatus Kapabacteria bacterium]